MLAERVWGKTKGFAAGHSGAMAKAKSAGIGAYQPAPSGFQTATVRGVERLARCTTSRYALLLPERWPFGNRIALIWP
jgi:hypothetical protein